MKKWLALVLVLVLVFIAAWGTVPAFAGGYEDKEEYKALDFFYGVPYNAPLEVLQAAIAKETGLELVAELPEEESDGYYSEYSIKDSLPFPLFGYDTAFHMIEFLDDNFYRIELFFFTDKALVENPQSEKVLAWLKMSEDISAKLYEAYGNPGFSSHLMERGDPESREFWEYYLPSDAQDRELDFAFTISEKWNNMRYETVICEAAGKTSCKMWLTYLSDGEFSPY